MPWQGADAPVEVVELETFIRDVDRLLSDEERGALIDYLAGDPRAGVVIPGTGGLRKLRWQLPGRGKRGGARVIYFFHDERLPVYLLALYAKNERSDLTATQRRQFAEFATAVQRRMRK
jgi:mRNA-degrading endonuclease RelE of RelBE toxin-antitoxin system